MANLFATAKKAPAAAKPAKASEKKNVTIAGLTDLASVDALIKALESVKVTLEADVKAQVLVEFKRQVTETKDYENFRGVDTGASASCEFKKRSIASALTADDIDMLNKYNIPFGKNVSVESCFRINPKYTEDSKLLEQISNAISKVKGVPEDFIEFQNSVEKNVVTADTISVACKNPKAFDEVARVIGVLSLKPKVEETKMAKLLDNVKELLIAEEAE